MLSQIAALPVFGRADLVVAVSPSFPALLAGLINFRVRRSPWILWLQDILPDGATSTGLLTNSCLLRSAQWLEHAAYSSATKIVVPSTVFTTNLTAKGVPCSKIDFLYNPATRIPKRTVSLHTRRPEDHLRVFSMGNIGHSQGLATIVRTFESASSAKTQDIRLIIAGTGMEVDAVRAELRTNRVEMLGLVDDTRLEEELAGASLGLVTQRQKHEEFNIPSKIMNFMTYGLPVVAAVDPTSEVARIINVSGGGWVIDNRDPTALVSLLSSISQSPAEQARRGQLAYRFAQANFAPAFVARKFESLLSNAAAQHCNRIPTEAHDSL